ncbi:serine carboxypeptidase S28 [Xylaria sp. CBS 124048]|nr:serine carboxypeptidase S28 [Xylaria sp. CBS 124048]
MKSTLLASVLQLLAQLSPVAALLYTTAPTISRHMKQKEMNAYHKAAVEDDGLVVMGTGSFNQLLDHDDTSKGTFKQRYWWNAEFFEEDGPIFLFNPGESDASHFAGYLENGTLPGYYAQQFKGAVIILEHRYWGKSRPFDTLTTETLQYLNLPNSIHDLTYFAKNIAAPFCQGSTCNSSENPWILMGGSYSGALAAWTSQLDPGVFHAYHASSAVVQAIYDFWEYYRPIAEGLPGNCSANAQAAIRHVDKVLASKNHEDVNALKCLFGLSALNDADFAEKLAAPFSEWQGGEGDVNKLCEALDSGSAKNGSTPVVAYASYIEKHTHCGKNGAGCNTYSSDIEWNTPNRLTGTRPWLWLVCNEPFGWYQVGPPESDGTSIVSSSLRPDHYQRRCPLMFPDTNGFTVGSVRGFTAQHLNMWTHGWDASFERVLFVNGERDPWRSATIAADCRPGGPVNSSDTIPSLIVEKGDHVPDLILGDDEFQTRVIESAVKIMGNWLKDWQKPASSKRVVI